MKGSSLEQALKANPAMTHSAAPHKNRQQFFANLGTIPFEKLVHKYARPPFTLRGAAVKTLRRLGLYQALRKLYKGT